MVDTAVTTETASDHHPMTRRRVIGFALGFFVLVNFQFPPGIEQGIRATDYLGAVTWVFLIFHLLRHFSLPRRVFFRGLLLFSLVAPWLVLGLITPRTLVEPIRWFLSITIAGAMLWLLRSPVRKYIMQGIVWGAAAQLVVVLLQFVGLFQLTVSLGLTAPDSDFTNTLLGRWRPPGMYGTNATPAVAALAVPAALGLVEEGRAGRRWILFAVLVVLATCVATLTRSTILVISVVLVIWGAIKVNNVRRAGKAAVLFSLAVAGILILGPPGGWERWKGATLESENAQERIESTIGSFQLAVSNPIGFGRDRYSEALQNEYGQSRTHNALTYLALSGNLPIAITLFFYLLGRGLSVFKNSYFEAWLALTLFGLCFWEEYFRNPVFITMGTLVVLSGVYQKVEDQ